MLRGRFLVLFFVSISIICIGAAASAEDYDLPPEPQAAPAATPAELGLGGEAWGPNDLTILKVHASEFRPQNYNTDLSAFWNTGITSLWTHVSMLHAPVQLPAGALVTGVGFDGYDIDPAENINWGVYWVTTAVGTANGHIAWYSHATSAGYFASTATLNPPHTVDVSKYYFALVDLQSTGQDMRIKGMRILYKLQVSPAPASATFNDVPTGHWAFQFVEALADSGITAGCGGGNYCPDDPVTRAQMAVYLAAALGLHWPG